MDIMKSGIYMGKGSIKIAQVSVPEISDNDVLIRNIYSSICGTDVAVYNDGPEGGHRITVGDEFGHETVSRVVNTGKNITDIKVGDRVYPYPRYARNDTKRAGTLGGFSEYILVPEAKMEHSLYRVPDEISDRVACLIEPFTVAMRSARRSMPGKGENAVVFGAGTIGIAAAMALKYFGLEKVMIADISELRLNIAKELGFETCLNKGDNSEKEMIEYFGEASSVKGKTSDIDIIIDAAGAESVFNYFMDKGKIGSRFVSVAVNNTKRELDLVNISFSQKMIIGSGGYMPEDVYDVFKLMSSKRWDIEKIITHEFRIDDLEKAINTAKETDKALNVVIKF